MGEYKIKKRQVGDRTVGELSTRQIRQLANAVLPTVSSPLALRLDTASEPHYN